MRYTEKDIPNIPLTTFMDALGEKSVGGYAYLKLYYAPLRDDAEALFVVDTKINKSLLYPNHKDLNDYLTSLVPKKSKSTKSKLNL